MSEKKLVKCHNCGELTSIELIAEKKVLIRLHGEKKEYGKEFYCRSCYDRIAR